MIYRKIVKIKHLFRKAFLQYCFPFSHVFRQIVHCYISLRQEDNTIYLAIEDKGAGIKSLQSARRSGSHGMPIMRERAEAFGGNFNVTSVPRQGTKIEVRVPVDVNDQVKAEKV